MPRYTLIMEKKTSLFVGRWQPFHEGHKTLIETVLKTGKPVTIAIRDTEIDHKNPFSTNERWTMIQKALAKYGALVKIIVIPDIDEICYGREVGYAIRYVEMDNSVKKISGTKTREAMKINHPVIWLTGQSGAGKTTIARALAPRIGAVVLDGDEMRESISLGAGFSKEDREEHNLRVARLATVLSRRSPVVVSVIAPFDATRKKVDAIVKPIWVHVTRRQAISKQRPYEVPKRPHLKVDTDRTALNDRIQSIVEYLKNVVRTKGK